MKKAIKEYWDVVLAKPSKHVIKHPFITILYMFVSVISSYALIFGIGWISKLKDKFSKEKEEEAP